MLFGCAAAFSVGGCGVFSGSRSAKRPIELVTYPGSHIDAECIVTFFAEDGSKYISRQKHIFYPLESAIVITANEPEGFYAWTMAKGDFKTLGPDYPAEMPYEICSSEISHAITLSMLAGGGFLDDVSGLRLEPKSISGQWYQPIQLLKADLGTIKQMVHRNLSTGEIEWVEIENPDNGAVIAGRSYNRRALRDSDITLPTAIDIFNVDKYGRPSGRIVKIDYKSLQLAE